MQPAPHITRFGDHIALGQTVMVRGKAHTDGKEIEFNLMSHGHSLDAPGTTVNLHVKFYLTSGANHGKTTVVNSYKDGKWQEAKMFKDLYIKPGAEFDLRIRVLGDRYEIRHNGHLITEYKVDASSPPSAVEFLQPKGDLIIEQIKYGGNFYTLPLESGFPDGHLRSNQKLEMYVVPKGDFHVDLIARNGDILVHFNPRFKEKKVVRNSCANQAWQKEEREGPFPFEKNRGYTIALENAPHSMQFYVDGKHFEAFAHRTGNPGDDYIGFRIDGETEVHQVEYV